MPETPFAPHLSPRWQRRLPKWLLALGALTLLLALISLSSVYTRGEWTAVVFDAAGLLLLQRPEKTPDAAPFSFLFNAARLTAVCTAGMGILYIIAGVYREGAQEWKLWRLRRRPHRHTVICGLGRVGWQLAADLCEQSDKSVVVIETDAENPQIEECRALGATVLVGDARAPSVRERAQVASADCIFVVTGNDARNLDIAEEIYADVEPETGERVAREHAAGRAPRSEPPIRCYTNLLSPTLARAAERSLPQLASSASRSSAPSTDAPPGPAASTTASPIVFHIFNTDENAARQLLLHEQWGLARTGDRPELNTVPQAEGEVAHYFVVGFGWMGQTVALQMARLAHFANRKRLRLTLIDRFDSDPAAQRLKQGFLDRHPGFCPAGLNLRAHVERADDPDAWSSRRARPAHDAWRIDREEAVEYAVNAEFLDMGSAVDAPPLVRRLIERIEPAVGATPRVALALCFDEDAANFEAALRLRSALAEARSDGRLSRSVPIYVYAPDEEGLADLLDRMRAETAFPLLPFGRREDVANYERITQTQLRTMARAVHEFYRERYGGAPWHELPPEMKASNEDAAAHGAVKLDVLGWHLRPRTAGAGAPAPALQDEDVELLAEIEHNRWMGERLSIGWRYGEKNEDGPENKRRTTFCAWERLADEKEKDERHIQALAEMYRAAGFVVEADSDARAGEPH